MKILMIPALASMAIAACATMNGSSSLSFPQACAGYNAGLVAATQANNAGKLTKEQVTAVSQIVSTVAPICEGPIPTTQAAQNAAISQVVAATTTLATVAAIKESTK